VIVLRTIWAFLWYRYGKILAPFMRENMIFLERPFRILTGIDSDFSPRDNGSEFINSAMLKLCNEHIQFTRSKAYRKNDNCFVEQKNYTCVKNSAGYYRFSAAAECDALAAVYHSLCPLMNFFMPTIKLISKKRIGSKIKRFMIKKLSALIGGF